MSYDQEPEYRERGPLASFEVRVESFDTSHFYADVVRAATDRIVGANYPTSTLVKAVREAADAMVSARINEVLTDTISELLKKPIQRYDTFGNPVGVPLSVEDIIRNGADTVLSEQVDSSGKPTNSAYTANKKSRLEWVVQQAVVSGLERELHDAAKQVRAEVTAKATASVAALLAGVKA